MTQFKVQIAALIVILAMVAVRAKPSDYDTHNSPCMYEDQRVEVCQYCAKKTKSPVVYPNCCMGKDEVYDWCRKFLDS